MPKTKRKPRKHSNPSSDPNPLNSNDAQSTHPADAQSALVRTDPSRPFVIDTIFPRHEIHLLGGPSHAGKTTLLFQLINDWRNGRPVFGYQSYPAPFCYVAADRSCASAIDTLSRVGIDADDTFPVLSMVDDGLKNLNDVIHAAQSLVPSLEVIFLDGIVRLVNGNMNYYETVAEFITQAIQRLQSENLTLFGVGHAAKPKEQDIVGPRQRFIGSVAWGAMCSTMVVVEPEHAKNVEDMRRKVYVMPANSPAKMFRYTLDLRGRFMLSAAVEEELIETTVPEEFRMLLFDVRERGTVVTSAEINAICAELGISEKSGRRYMDKLMREGKIERVGALGKFKIVRVQ